MPRASATLQAALTSVLIAAAAASSSDSNQTEAAAIVDVAGIDPCAEAGEEAGQSSLFIIGVLMGLFGSIGINTGNNMQSLGMHNLEESHQVSRLSHHKLQLACCINPELSLASREHHNYNSHQYIYLHKVLLMCSIPSTHNDASLALQAEIDAAEKPEDTPPVSTCKSKLWVIGTIVFILSSFMNFAAFGFAAQSTLASLVSLFYRIHPCTVSNPVPRCPATPTRCYVV